jgi:hypothetical protein
MNWPTLLPNPTLSFSGDAQSSLSRIQMESTRVRQRRRFSRELRFYSATWEFSDLELAVFEAFLLHKLNSGADWFTINLPLGSEFRSVLARVRNGEYSVSDGGAPLRWKVSTTLEVEDAAISAPQLVWETSYWETSVW